MNVVRGQNTFYILYQPMFLYMVVKIGSLGSIPLWAPKNCVIVRIIRIHPEFLWLIFLIARERQTGVNSDNKTASLLSRILSRHAAMFTPKQRNLLHTKAMMRGKTTQP